MKISKNQKGTMGKVKDNLKREAVKNIMAKTGDLARLDAKVNHTYTLNIKEGRMASNI
ncbi:hypothetical protein [Peribacillus simplex]|uniref:hypothetical protein n=1 Tax=Peribacillus simplex TaxID=1478 RepID=UPI0024C1BBF4|nr:hypothetical protein [Peribacillus simplex]WHY54354.1 hypothetical protein QNH43_14245 [Peribacillus simplex]